MQALKCRLPVRYIMACNMQQFDLDCKWFSHLMVSLWHNEGRGLLLRQEGEVENVGDGHVPCLGVHHLR